VFKKERKKGKRTLFAKFEENMNTLRRFKKQKKISVADWNAHLAVLAPCNFCSLPIMGC